MDWEGGALIVVVISLSFLCIVNLWSWWFLLDVCTIRFRFINQTRDSHFLRLMTCLFLINHLIGNKRKEGQ